MVCVEALVRGLERVESAASTDSFHSCKSQPDHTTVMQSNNSAPSNASGTFDDLRSAQYAAFPGVECPKTFDVLKQLMSTSDLLRISTFNGAMYIGIFAGTSVLHERNESNGLFHIMLYAAELLRGNPNPDVIIMNDDGGCKCDDVLIPWWSIGSLTSVTTEHAAKLVEPVELRNAWCPPRESNTSDASVQKRKLNPMAVPFEPKSGDAEPLSPAMASECGSITPVSPQPFQPVPFPKGYQIPQWYPNMCFVDATAYNQHNMANCPAMMVGFYGNFVQEQVAYQQQYSYPAKSMMM